MFGRRRYFPEIESGIPMLVAQAERMAINMPIQGAAADIVKKAMLKTDEWLQETDLDATMLLQVHDEIVLEVAKKDVESVSSKLKQIMEEVVSFDVPLEVEVEAGENWGQLH